MNNEPIQFLTAPVPFTRDQVGPLGLSLHALRNSPRYTQLFHGVWIDNEPETAVPAPMWAGFEWANVQVGLSGMLRLHEGLAGTGITAARLYGLPLPRRLTDKRIHVASACPDFTLKRRGAVLHRYTSLKVANFCELPLISVPQLIVELATVLTVDELIAVAEAAIGQWHSGPLATPKAIRAEVDSRRYLRNRPLLASVLTLMRQNVDSPQETWLRLWIISQGFPEPTVHPPVQCSNLSYVLHPDLGYPELRLAIEYEGDHHRSSDRQFAADNERIQNLVAQGWTVLRVSKATNMDRFRQLLRHHLARN
ncbi:hypothetical protein [Brevibacterium sp. RIT 803]|uniref:endonuclease domain-containing protein n=1 Tax=Brevibacterium sp. RIT 803 TaxID=2810210 RepID=UPI00194F0854|nr:hypothetical protein [Brevibacterium sp. RIT 803]MBM6590230.1 hypothetical protein [Brevibacterium sp. RIT 803]